MYPAKLSRKHKINITFLKVQSTEEAQCDVIQGETTDDNSVRFIFDYPV